MAESYATDGYSIKAIALLKQCVGLDPSSTNARLRLADLYEMTGLHAESRAELVTLEGLYAQRGDAVARAQVKASIAALDLPIQ